jgi:hypothetical protein
MITICCDSKQKDLPAICLDGNRWLIIIVTHVAFLPSPVGLLIRSDTMNTIEHHRTRI